MSITPSGIGKMTMKNRHIIRLNNCVTIAVWLTNLNPSRFYPPREFSMVIITVPSRFGLVAYRVTSQRSRLRSLHLGTFRISWGDPEVPENSRVISDHFLQRVEAFTQRMWGNQAAHERFESSCARWLLGLLRRELGHDFFDHDRLHLVMEKVVALLHSD
ncbi:hypothetical protein PGTUg99_028674 [Puccinia graminis f. sp. tritici]|uniref:Uncharacterized protein n=2 Tax=Puccinia graminis f. sp. tritici TaxID=56615 RepID=A0A5B0LU81_PUCGR|nr:hypothetical protein PGTUg99_028674 [Puccinia graminis f. sp. tritici]